MKSAEYLLMHSVLERLRVVSECALTEDEMDYLMLLLQVTHGRSAYPEQTIETLQPVIREIIRIAESETVICSKITVHFTTACANTPDSCG